MSEVFFRLIRRSVRDIESTNCWFKIYGRKSERFSLWSSHNVEISRPSCEAPSSRIQPRGFFDRSAEDNGADDRLRSHGIKYNVSSTTHSKYHRSGQSSLLGTSDGASES